MKKGYCPDKHTRIHFRYFDYAIIAVSYTHLDVYKRQPLFTVNLGLLFSKSKLHLKKALFVFFFYKGLI